MNGLQYAQLEIADLFQGLPSSCMNLILSVYLMNHNLLEYIWALFNARN